MKSVVEGWMRADSGLQLLGQEDNESLRGQHTKKRWATTPTMELSSKRDS
jgi:hypothetical protein